MSIYRIALPNKVDFVKARDALPDFISTKLKVAHKDVTIEKPIWITAGGNWNVKLKIDGVVRLFWYRYKAGWVENTFDPKKQRSKRAGRW